MKFVFDGHLLGVVYNVLLQKVISAQFQQLINNIAMRKERIMSHRPSVMSKSSHIMEDNLNRRSQMLQKYQTDIQTLIERIDTKPIKTNQTIDEAYGVKITQKSRAQSIKKETISYEGATSANYLNDYQKLILGLEYSLENEKRLKQSLSDKNISLQTQISNLRNLLIGPDQQKHYQKTVFKEYQDKIAILQKKILEQKNNYQFIIQSKNQQIGNVELALRTLQKRMENQQKDTLSNRKILQLMGVIQQLQSSLAKKNISLQKALFHNKKEADSDDEQDLKEIERKNKIQIYKEQLDISNRLIIKKNIELLNLSKKIVKIQEVLGVIEQYLDKKQVKNIDLSVLQHPCVMKLRSLLREKAVFQKQLLGQLNDHSKKMNSFQQQLLQKDSQNGDKITQLSKDNKRLLALVSSLQGSLKNADSIYQNQKKQNEYLKKQIQQNKKEFVQEILKLKSQLSSISSITKNQFDRLKLQNLKYSQQNKSLLFLVGEKQKQLHKKGEAIKTFQDYKDKINNLNISVPQKRKIQSVAQQIPTGTKLVLMNTFSQWMMEWNKMRNWNNKKILLNIILDKEQIQNDSLGSITYLINVLHEALLNSKNIQIQERATILLSCYLKHSILKNINLFVSKISPVAIRGFRGLIEGQDPQRHRLLNEATLKIINSMSEGEFKWSAEMTNQMLSVNGLKYLFNLITNSQVDELVQAAYNSLIFIARQNQMISFMNSFDITTILLSHLHSKYPFLSFALELLKTLLVSRDYIKSQKTLLQFRKLFSLIKQDDDEDELEQILDCLLILMQNSLFVKSVNKVQAINILNQSIAKNEKYSILKKMAQVQSILLSELQVQNIPKLSSQIDKLIGIIRNKRFGQNRFNRTLRLLLKITEIFTENPQIDDKIIIGLTLLYHSYGQIEAKSRPKLNNIINLIYQRNKEVVNKYSNEEWIVSLIQAYKQCNQNQENIFLLRILLFQHEQKRTTQILRTGRQTLINKHITDSLLPDYNIAILSLKNLLAISKQKYSQKFVNKSLFGRIVGKVLTSRSQQDYLGTCVSVLYFFCKSEEACGLILELGLVQKLFNLITQRHDKEGLIYKCFTLLQLCHTSNYKKKILNYLLANDPNLKILKTINFILKKAKNKLQMGTRVVFIYDFLNGKTAIQSLALLIQQNTWMMQDLIDVRNQYVSKVEPLVYKIQLLLHNMSASNAKVRKIYEKFKIEGEYESQDDRE